MNYSSVQRPTSKNCKALTRQLIFTKTRNDNLQNIKNLNLWGNQLEDLSLLEHMPNLQVISLSVNNINTLKYFANCYKLQELYLRKNNIKVLEEIQHLIDLPQLKILWLHDNPCANTPNYRSIILSQLPNLIKLDNDLVTQQQKDRFKAKFDEKGIQNIQPDSRLRKQSIVQSQNKNKSIMNQKNNNFLQNLQQNRSEVFVNQKLSSSSRKQQVHNQQYHQQALRSSNISRHPNLDLKFQKKPEYQTPKQPSIQVQTPSKSSSNKHHQVQIATSNNFQQKQTNRNSNIMMAVLSLLEELDIDSLEIVQRETQRKITKIVNYQRS